MTSRVSSRDSGSSENPPLSRRDTQAKSTTGKDKRSLADPFKRMWTKLGLDQPTILLMVKYVAVCIINNAREVLTSD